MDRLKAIGSSALTWCLLAGLLGLVQLVAGVFILYGSGWAMLAGGVASLAVASFIRQGMTSA